MWRVRLFAIRFRADDLPWSRIILVALLMLALYSCWSWSRRAVALSIVNASAAAATLELGSDRREVAACSSSVHFVDLDRAWTLRVGTRTITSADVRAPTGNLVHRGDPRGP